MTNNIACLYCSIDGLCVVCKDEPEPGYIELPDNGPIVPCWLCNREEWLKETKWTP